MIEGEILFLNDTRWVKYKSFLYAVPKETVS